MKKLTAFTLCTIFALTLCGCKSNPKTQSSYLYYYETVEVSSKQEASSREKASSKPQTIQSSSSSKPERSWESTVVAPYKVIFYKNGQAVESTDAEQNLKIAKHIESYFKGKENLRAYHSSILPEMIYGIKANETAVELYFDKKIEFYGGVIHASTQTLFIPLTGNYSKMLISGDSNAVYKSGPLDYRPAGLEQFLPDVLNSPEQLGAPEYCAIGSGYRTTWGRYDTTQTAETHGIQGMGDLYVYKDDDGVVIKQDAKTGQIVEVDYNVICSYAKEPLSEQKAIDAAKIMATRLYDISKYDKYEVTKPFTTGVLVTITATANNEDVIQVRVNEDATISKIVKGYDIVG